MNYFNKKSFTMRQVVGLLTIVFLGIAVIAYAAVNIPNTFSANTTISSSQVNANFTALGDAMPAVKENSSVACDAVTTTTSYQNMMSLNVTPPVNGYIVLSGGGYFFQSGATSGVNNFAFAYLTTSSGGGSTTAITAFSAVSTTGMVNRSPLHVQGIFPVIGGMTYTFYMTAYRDSTGSNALSICAPRLTALFVPGTALP